MFQLSEDRMQEMLSQNFSSRSTKSAITSNRFSIIPGGVQIRELLEWNKELNQAFISDTCFGLIFQSLFNGHDRNENKYFDVIFNRDNTPRRVEMDQTEKKYESSMCGNSECKIQASSAFFFFFLDRQARVEQSARRVLEFEAL
jgi:hypothetical protein